MGAAGFLLVALILASTGPGLWHALEKAAANRWWDTGDGLLFWTAWAEDTGRLRVAAAALAGLALITLARAGPVRWRRPAARLVRAAGGLAVLAPALLLLLAAQGTAALLRPLPVRATSVVFVMLDTLRLDHTGWGGRALGRTTGLTESPTPHLDALAARGAAFSQAVSPAPWTKPSVATMFTGLVPSRHRAVGRPGRGYYPDLAPVHRTLAEAFRSGGWQTLAISTNPNVSRRFGFDQGFARHHDEDLPAEKVVALAREWIGRTDRPYFLYLHFNDAHYPFDPPEGYRGLYDSTRSLAQLDGESERLFRLGLQEFEDEDREHLQMAYAEEVRYLDDQVGPFLEELLAGEKPVLVVVVADHGEEFFEHGDVGHGHTLFDELLRVPLQFAWNDRAAGLRPGLIERQVGLTDLLPTLLDFCGLDWPPGAENPDGRSFLGWLEGSEEPGDRPVCSETDTDGSARSGFTGPLRSWREPGAKFIQTLAHPARPGAPLLFWLFDLESDPGEQRNLLATPGTATGERELAAALRDRLAGCACLAEKDPAPLRAPLDLSGFDPGEIVRLRELGYLDGLETGAPPALEPAPETVPGALWP